MIYVFDILSLIVLIVILVGLAVQYDYVRRVARLPIVGGDNGEVATMENSLEKKYNDRVMQATYLMWLLVATMILVILAIGMVIVGMALPVQMVGLRRAYNIIVIVVALLAIGTSAWTAVYARDPEFDVGDVADPVLGRLRSDDGSESTSMSRRKRAETWGWVNIGLGVVVLLTASLSMWSPGFRKIVDSSIGDKGVALQSAPPSGAGAKYGRMTGSLYGM